MTTVAEFEKTERQRAALDLLNHHRHTLLYGGSRSGKTAIIVRNIFLRALKRSSRHLMCRLRFNHAKTSLWYDTVPKVLRIAFPGVEIRSNKSDWFWEIDAPNGPSTIWLAGLDDKDRTEKILGNEYSTVYVNEASQIGYDAITTLWTRLAEDSGLNLRAYYDENPPSRKHWTFPLFINGVYPDGTKHDLDVASMQMNPVHNLANLPAEYIKILEGLPKRQRERFLEGLFLTDVEGALWSDAMVEAALERGRGEIRDSVVAVDPSVSNRDTSDECGIVVCGVDEYDRGGMIEDCSGLLSTRKWAQRAVAKYHEHQCSAIVAETNNGGQLVEDAVHNVDRTARVVQVHASRSKWARAEPVAQLYEMGEAWHDGRAPDLEEELTTYVPTDAPHSPNRLDALVWGMTHLVVGPSGGVYHFG